MPITAGPHAVDDSPTAIHREESYTGFLLPPIETKQRALDDVMIPPEKINDCFALFFEHYCPIVPVLNAANDISPNAIYERCPFLFWSIITVGSQRYYEDPTIFSRLSSRIVALAFRYITERLTPLHTIEGLILLCAWPVPVTHMYRDTTHTIAGAALQLALQCGLHIVGEGQEFARTYIRENVAEKRYRANLWYYCLIICQSASIADGLPPLNVLDSFSFPRGRKEVTGLLSSRLLFQTRLHRIQVAAIFEIMQCAMGPTSDSNAVNAMIDVFDGRVREFESELCDGFDEFVLNSTRLHIATFRLMVNPEDMDNLGIIKLYSISRSVIEGATELDKRIGFSVYSTFYHLRSLLLAASLILKISRSHLSTQVDLVGGERSYFSVIQFARRRSVEPSDLDSRVVSILTQLWSSRLSSNLRDEDRSSRLIWTQESSVS
ncbi:hypothetical protein BGW36DRAFT_387780 [Talaromyces proteolyticus]|uniref:Transcription factor domain-containing protein n=1 Tax=Talaromyces proteolyticus TaxID=1131652 RepID=A0AAD4KGE6_9EURO|nr:uncharacterized protein BGW36DRAFT_387780 [Talaromyces proteolyticus]KAH8691150.1 hypothetical protein BGW36DRAFT_387780 [Talaromyces proteolyticus]